MKNFGLSLCAAALLVAAPMMNNNAFAGSPPTAFTVQSASLNGDFAAEVEVEDGDYLVVHLVSAGCNTTGATSPHKRIRESILLAMTGCCL